MSWHRSEKERIRRVYAKVTVQPKAVRERVLTENRDRMDRKFYKEARKALLASNHVRLLIKLSAEDVNGRVIESPGSFMKGGPRRGIGAIWVRYHGPPLPAKERKRMKVLKRYRLGTVDVEDSIDLILGRSDRSQESSKTAELNAWDGLLAALAEADIPATAEELIALPLTVEFDREAAAELERGHSERGG